MPEEKKGIEGINYADAGVSITAQNEVNAKIKKVMQELGLSAEGLFGGAVDISHLKGKDSVPIGVVSKSLFDDESLVAAGRLTCDMTLDDVDEGTEPIAILDYYASEGMEVDEVPDFVKGVATAGIERGVPTIGGESAEMPGTYNEGKRDSYVHVITHGDQGTTVDIANLIKDMEKPLLCASSDGTGTKTRIVKDPRDIIYHGGNDLGAIGVKVVAFSLYVAGNDSQEELEHIAAKSERICETLGITAIDPTIEFKPEEYAEGQVDIAATVIGVIDEKDLITGEEVEEGDIIIGFATDCLMTNGYSLAREYCKIIDEDWDSYNLEGLERTSISDELSKPHVPYTDILFGNEESEGILSRFKGQIKATAHITGGGQKDNIERMVPDGLCAEVKQEVLPLPPIVSYFMQNNADFNSLYEAFNMGVGFTVTVGEDIADEVVKYVNDCFKNSIHYVSRTAARIGTITQPENEEKFRWIE